MSWKLAIASKQVVSGWGAEAVRLRRFLDVISEQVAVQHGRSLRWCNDRLSVEQWNDLAAVTGEVLDERLRTEDGTSLFTGGASTGTVQGYLDGVDEAFVNSLWSVGSDHECQFSANQDFYTDVAGGARQLNEYPVSWLVELVRQTAQCVDAYKARVHSMAIFKAVKRRGIKREIGNRVGAITLAANGINASLPESVTIHPGIDSKPGSVILTVDLDMAVNDPDAIVDDLLAIHNAMSTDSAA